VNSPLQHLKYLMKFTKVSQRRIQHSSFCFVCIEVRLIEAAVMKMLDAMEVLVYELRPAYERRKTRRTRVVASPKFHKFFNHLMDHLLMWGMLFVENEEGIEAVQSLFDRIDRKLLGLHARIRLPLNVQRWRNRIKVIFD